MRSKKTTVVVVMVACVIFVSCEDCEPETLVRCEAEYQRCENVIARACKADDKFCPGSPANDRWRMPLVIQCSDNYAACLDEGNQPEVTHD